MECLCMSCNTEDINNEFHFLIKFNIYNKLVKEETCIIVHKGITI